MFETKCNYCGKKIIKKNYLAKKFKHFFCCRNCSNKFKKKENSIVSENNYAKIIIQSTKHGLFEPIIDIDDIDKVKKIRWYVSYDKTSDSFYVKSKYVQLHRLIMDCPIDLTVDHINHNTLDNRKCNLRICTQKQNNENRNGCFSSNKSSKIRNVSWHQRTKKWQVSIKVNDKQKYIGLFVNLKDAEQAAISARKKYYTHSIENMSKEDTINANK